MYKYIIEGSKKLEGSVKISGAKNSALPILMATLLTNKKCTIHRVPNLRDIQTTIKLLEALGKEIQFKQSTMTITEKEDGLIEAPYEIVKTMRASICVLGPLLARYKQAKVSLPGGCAFGPRPIDLHLTGLSKLSANIAINHGYIEAETKKLIGDDIDMMGTYGPTVLGTDNVMMAACLAEGKTKILNSALEPEVSDLANCLNKMGANVTNIGSDTLIIEGVNELHGFEHTIIPDRIETGTFIAATIGTEGNIEINDTNPALLENVIEMSKECGAKFDFKDNSQTICVSMDGKPNPIDITTKPYPGFPTDLQAQFLAALLKAKGQSKISETIYLERFQHIAEMQRLGANIELDNSCAIVNGVDKLSSTAVMASNIRAGAGIVIATLMAEGISEVKRIYHIERGYEKLEEKISNINGIIRKEWEIE